MSHCQHSSVKTVSVPVSACQCPHSTVSVPLSRLSVFHCQCPSVSISMSAFHCQRPSVKTVSVSVSVPLSRLSVFHCQCLSVSISMSAFHCQRPSVKTVSVSLSVSQCQHLNVSIPLSAFMSAYCCHWQRFAVSIPLSRVSAFCCQHATFIVSIPISIVSVALSTFLSQQSNCQHSSVSSPLSLSAFQEQADEGAMQVLWGLHIPWCTRIHVIYTHKELIKAGRR